VSEIHLSDAETIQQLSDLIVQIASCIDAEAQGIEDYRYGEDEDCRTANRLRNTINDLSRVMTLLGMDKGDPTAGAPNQAYQKIEAIRSGWDFRAFDDEGDPILDETEPGPDADLEYDSTPLSTSGGDDTPICPLCGSYGGERLAVHVSGPVWLCTNCGFGFRKP